MNDPIKYPKIRNPIEIRMETAGNEQVLYINCPLGVSEGPLLLAPAVGPIISCFDGNQSISEIANSFSEFGVTPDLVSELVQIFNNNHFLDTPDFHHKQKNIRAEFAKAKVRESALADVAYPSEERELKNLLNSYLKNGTAKKLKAKEPLIGVVSPHIDYLRGGSCYGATYCNLPKSEHDLFVILGTAHQFSKVLFHLTEKDFNTPFGLFKTDKTFVQKIADSYGQTRSFADEILHRREHSLELQLPFLAHRTGKTRVVPILIGSFYPLLAKGIYPHEDQEYEDFMNGLIEAVKHAKENQHRICFIAGVDMSHVGPAFGDNFQLTKEFMTEVETRDRVYLETILNRDKKALYEHIVEDADARRICGFPTMYTLLDLFDRLELDYKAELFSYQQAVDMQTGCAVTFAGLGFY